MRERVQEILMEIGIPANLKGFKYILDIMELFEEDEAWRNAKMMIVYEKVARMNKTNYCRVEKSIRYAFSNAVTYGDLALVEKYLSVVNVTNGNLLHTLYARACLKIKNCTKHVFLSPFHDRIKKKGAFICQDVMN